MNVYYESMKYEVTIDSLSVTSEDLLSKFGGTLGLFLGISFLSFIEIVEF